MHERRHPHSLATALQETKFVVEGLVEALASAPADRYLSETLAPAFGGQKGIWDPEPLLRALTDPAMCLAAIYGRYAFARRGKERKALSAFARQAFESVFEARTTFLFVEPEAIWSEFERICLEANHRSHREVNRDVVVGFATMALEVAKTVQLSLASYVCESIRAFGRVDQVFFDLVGLRGVGPKVASTILRDFVCVFGVEPLVVARDTLYLQPVDRWTRSAAPLLIEDAVAKPLPDWILAGKLGRAAREHDVSGIRLNMGISHIGGEAACSSRPESRFTELLRTLTHPDGDPLR